MKMRGSRAQLNFPDTNYSTDSFMKASRKSAQPCALKHAHISWYYSCGKIIWWAWRDLLISA